MVIVTLLPKILFVLPVFLSRWFFRSTESIHNKIIMPRNKSKEEIENSLIELGCNQIVKVKSIGGGTIISFVFVNVLT